MSAAEQREISRPVAGATLLAGARIDFHGDEQEFANRISLSSGTLKATDDPELAPLYAKDTFVPRAPWRRPAGEELAHLRFDRSRCGVPWRTSADVAVIRISDEVLQTFTQMLEEHGIREKANKATYVSVSQHPRWTANVDALGRHLATIADGESKKIFFRMADPNKLTLTKDEFGAEAHRQRLVGLHIDHWDGLPLRHRSRARNRICINLSREPRYSLFFNLPMMEMFRSAGLRDPDDIYSDFRGLYLGQRFMTICPDYPVVRLRIDPGEAYVIPTDNLIHDASTIGNRFTDITLTYLGLFVPDGLRSAA